MADISISKSRGKKYLGGSSPMVPAFIVGDDPIPLNPPGSNTSHSPVTIGSPANGLSLVGQELSLGLASSGVTGALSGTDWSTFNGKLNLTSPITGYVIGANTALAATDTILGAFGKIQGQIGARVSGTIASGQVAFGTAANTVGGDSGLVWNNTVKRLELLGTDSSIIRLRGNTNGAGYFVTQINSNSTAIALGNSGVITGTGTSNILWSNTDLDIFISSTQRARFFSANGNLRLQNGGTFTDSGFRLDVNGTARVQSTLMVGGALSPTNTLDVNGTTRIRTISNAVGNFLTTSAIGVVQQRTAAETLGDIGAQSTIAGTLTDTYVATIVAGVPTWAVASGGGISGLTTNRLPKATSGTTIADSRLIDNGTSAYFSNQGLNDVAFGLNASLNQDFSNNNTVAIGPSAATNNTTGDSWVAIGSSAGLSAITSSDWTAIGRSAGQSATSQSWTAIGRSAGFTTTTGQRWVAIGWGSAQLNNTGSDWVAIGYQAGANNTSLSNCVVIGFIAARNYSGGTTNATAFSNGVYIGHTTKVSAASAVNEIVIGYLAEGIASNTIVIGNTSITDNYIRGNFNITDARNFIFQTTTGTKIGTATNQKLAFWNATPIVQPTTAVTAATLVSNLGTPLTSTDTFDGYTLAQIAKALRNTGLLA